MRVSFWYGRLTDILLMISAYISFVVFTSITSLPLYWRLTMGSQCSRNYYLAILWSALPFLCMVIPILFVLHCFPRSRTGEFYVCTSAACRHSSFAWQSFRWWPGHEKLKNSFSIFFNYKPYIRFYYLCGHSLFRPWFSSSFSCDLESGVNLLHLCDTMVASTGITMAREALWWWNELRAQLETVSVDHATTHGA